MISPISPSVQVTSVTRAPSAAYLAMVAPVPIDSSSGCACTSSRLRSNRVPPKTLMVIVYDHDATARPQYEGRLQRRRQCHSNDADTHAIPSARAGLIRSRFCDQTRLRGQRVRGSLPREVQMTESFPRQQARTRKFTLGVPRAFQVSPDGERVIFLRSKAGDDPVTCLWEADTATGRERLVADPRALGADEENLPPEERARRER